MRFPREIENMLLEMEADRREALVRRIKADPVAHKATLQWADGIEPRWLYYKGGVDKRGTRRRFCYTTTRNAAGYFLAFDEVVRKDGTGERKNIVASKRRKTVAAKAEARWKAYLNRNKK
jgi:hypothetical protein